MDRISSGKSPTQGKPRLIPTQDVIGYCHSWMFPPAKREGGKALPGPRSGVDFLLSEEIDKAGRDREDKWQVRCTVVASSRLGDTYDVKSALRSPLRTQRLSR